MLEGDGDRMGGTCSGGVDVAGLADRLGDQGERLLVEQAGGLLDRARTEHRQAADQVRQRRLRRDVAGDAQRRVGAAALLRREHQLRAQVRELLDVQ